MIRSLSEVDKERGRGALDSSQGVEMMFPLCFCSCSCYTADLLSERERERESSFCARLTLRYDTRMSVMFDLEAKVEVQEF